MTACTKPVTTPTTTTTAALSLVGLGYWLGSRGDSNSRMNYDLYYYQQRWIHTIHATVIPVYTMTVLLYLSWRMYSDRFASSSIETCMDICLVEKGKKQQVAKPLKEEEEAQPIDLSGSFQLTTNENFEAFLAAQGVPWVLRRAANQARPTHKITHQGNVLTIHVQGIIESSTTYLINGPPVEGLVRGRLFQDTVTYLYDDDDTSGVVVGMRTTKHAMDDGYTIEVCRRLSSDQQQIVMSLRVMFEDPDKPDVCAKQTFQRTAA